MDEEKKVFNIVWIVILLIIALWNDALEIIFDILAATGVGVVGEVAMEPINAILGAFFSSVFIMKCGFNGPAVTQMVTMAAEFLGIPGRTIGVVAGIWIANHPESAVSKAAKGASALEGGELGEVGELGELAEGAEAIEAAETAETVAQGASTAEATAEEAQSIEAEAGAAEVEPGGAGEEKKESIEGERRKEGEEVRPGEEDQNEQRREREEENEPEGESEEEKEEEEDISATDAEKDEEKVEEEEFFEKTPTPERDEDNEEDDDENEEPQNSEAKETQPPRQGIHAVPPRNPAQVDKEEEVRRGQKQLKKPREITVDEDEDTMGLAA